MSKLDDLLAAHKLVQESKAIPHDDLWKEVLAKLEELINQIGGECPYCGSALPNESNQG